MSFQKTFLLSKNRTRTFEHLLKAHKVLSLYFSLFAAFENPTEANGTWNNETSLYISRTKLCV